MKKKLSAALVLVLGLSACTWVPLSSEGESVMVMNASQAAQCERLGQTTSKVMNKVGFLKRSQSQKALELERLARNEAASMGGNAIVPATEETEGRQRFIVYRCP